MNKDGALVEFVLCRPRTVWGSGSVVTFIVKIFTIWKSNGQVHAPDT